MPPKVNTLCDACYLEQARNRLVQLLVLSTFAEHNVTEVLNDILQLIRTYPDLASQSAWAQLIVPLRSRETPNAMDAFDAYLARYSRPIDKVFLCLFARILWEGAMCEDPEIATWAAWSRKSTENWERTGWSNFVKCWKDAGLGPISQGMDEWDPKLGWVIWSMKQDGVFGEGCVDHTDAD
ncbi:hypothetical protein FRC06_005623 [Ceratobasidium sp. 370]|nr:hypothetical protein FRC06_005623 [Ceratobasidium sp. 370]